MHQGIPEWGVWGSVRRAIRSEKGDGVSIVAYGADPAASWETNTAAIHEALADVDAGGAVVVPKGVFVASVRVETTGVRIVGPGTLKTPDDATQLDNDCPLRILADDVTIEGLSIDGNRSGNPDLDDFDDGRWADGIAIYANGVTVRNCRIQDTIGHGIIVWNEGFDTATKGARSNIVIEGNRVSGEGQRAGIDIASTDVTAAVSNHIRITGNYLSDGRPIVCHTAYSVLVESNQLVDASAISVHTNSARCVVRGNYSSGCSVGVTVDDATDCVVESNFIVDAETLGVNVQDACSGVVVRGNYVKDAGGVGVLVGDTSTDVAVEDNTILSPGSHGVSVSSTGADIRVRRNTVDTPGGYGINVPAANAGLWVEDNEIRDGGPGILQTNTSATQVIIARNRVHNMSSIALYAYGSGALVKGNVVDGADDALRVGNDDVWIVGNDFTATTGIRYLNTPTSAFVEGNRLAVTTQTVGFPGAGVYRHNIVNGTYLDEGES